MAAARLPSLRRGLAWLYGGPLLGRFLLYRVRDLFILLLLCEWTVDIHLPVRIYTKLDKLSLDW